MPKGRGENKVEKGNGILGFVANDASIMQCFAFQHKDKPWNHQTDDYESFSVGHYCSGNTLLSVQPTDSSHNLLLRDIIPEQGAQLLLAQASMPFGGDDKKPSSVARWRNWLLASDGQFDWGDRRVRIQDNLPRFLNRVKAPGDNDLLFGQLLSEFHDNRLMHLQSSSKKLALQVQKTSRTAGPDVSVLLSNGNILLAYRRYGPLYYKVFEGIDNCERCAILHPSERVQTRARSHDYFRGICVTNRPFGQEKWSEVPEESVLIIESSIKYSILDKSEIQGSDDGG